MNKKVVAIVSMLKPVSDPRNYEKIAISLGNTNKYEINIIGFAAKNMVKHQNIIFHPTFLFNRISVSRLLAPYKTLRFCIKLKPELIIVTCAELLPVMVLYKILFGVKIIYDIQENYFRNILYTNTYPLLIRYPLAALSRLMEYILSPFISRFILAESIYSKQLKFIGSKFEIFENKAVIPKKLYAHKKHRTKPASVFLYSGTIAEHYGIFEAIDFVSRLSASGRSVELRIAGFSPGIKFYKHFLKKIEPLHFIKIIGGNAFVPHNMILNEIKNADFCLLPYRPNKATEGRIPTKLYECLALETPVIITPNPAWNHLIKANNAGIIFDFKGKLPDLTNLETNNFYQGTNTSKYLWDQDLSRFIKMIDSLYIPD